MYSDVTDIGYNSANNGLNVVSGGSFFGQGTLTVGASGSVNRVLVDGISSRLQISHYDLFIGQNGSGNSLVVTNGAKLAIGRDFGVGKSGNGSNNTGSVSGSGSQILVTGDCYVGGTGIGNSLTITNGAVVKSLNGHVLGVSNRVVVSGGAWTNSQDLYVGNEMTMNGSGSIYCGYDFYLYSGSRITVQDQGSLFTCGQSVHMGNSTNATIVVSGQGALFQVAGYNLGVGADTANLALPSFGNALIITNGGQVTVAQDLYVGTTNGVSNTVFVASGGILDVARYWNVGTGGFNRVDNNGGIYQFKLYNPSLTPGVFGSITITNGCVSFRNIVNADVLCNRVGQSLSATATMVWGGSNNAFRLNSATNNSSGQAYTFTTSAGATNFARLELVNGALYHGGNVAIGTNGSLLVSNGVGRIDGLLTFDPTSSLNIDVGSSSCLVATNVSLGNCALNVTLGAAPAVNTPVMIVSNSLGGVAGTISGQFSNGSQWAASANGTNYILSAAVTSGSGVALTARIRTSGSIMFIE